MSFETLRKLFCQSCHVFFPSHFLLRFLPGNPILKTFEGCEQKEREEGERNEKKREERREREKPPPRDQQSGFGRRREKEEECFSHFFLGGERGGR